MIELDVQTFWHSSAHVLGQALELEYGADLTIGPALEEGFYYDWCAPLNCGSSSCLAKGHMPPLRGSVAYQMPASAARAAAQLGEDPPLRLAAAVLSAATWATARSMMRRSRVSPSACSRCGQLRTHCATALLPEEEACIPPG